MVTRYSWARAERAHRRTALIPTRNKTAAANESPGTRVARRTSRQAYEGKFLNEKMKVLALMTLTGSVAVLTQSYAEPSGAAHKPAASGAVERVGGHPNF